MYFPDVNTGYAVETIGFILKTTNAGADWTVLSIGAYTPIISICFTDVNTGYVTSVNGIVYKTINGGIHWDTLSTGTSSSLQSVQFINTDTGYVAGDWGTILKTTNAGVSWTLLNSGTTYNLFSVYFTDANTGYAAGDYGTILNTKNGGGFPVGLSDASYKSGTLKIYPNPSSKTIYIETSSTTATCRQLLIINTSGQHLITRQITTLKTQLDISTLPQGVYFVRLTSDKSVATGKFIKQ